MSDYFGNLYHAIEGYLEGGRHEIYDALVLEVTNGCSFGRCPTCYANCIPKGRRMSLAEVRGVFTTMQDLIRQGKMDEMPKEIWVAGGEPTDHPDLLHLIREARRHVDYIALVTNGFALADPKYAKQIVDRAVGLSEVAITLNSASPEAHNYMVQPIGTRYTVDGGEWVQVVRGLVEVTKAAEVARRSDLTVAINLNMNASIYEHSLQDLVKVVRSYGGRIDKIIFQTMQMGGRAVDIKNRRYRQFQTVDEGMVKKYFDQAQRRIGSKDIREAILIDPLNKGRASAKLQQHPMWGVGATPCVCADGRFEYNVVRTNPLHD